jgi:AcrR family transcriptional regulator
MPQLTDVKNPLEEKTNAARTRSHILSAAARVMGAYGYSASTLRQIADAAKMEAGSIYYHFESKEAILDEVLDRGLRDMVEGVSQVLIEEQSYPDFRSRIADAINAHMMFLFARSEFTSANIRMYGQLPKEMRARHRPVRQDYSGKWEECLKNAKDAGEIRDDIMIIPLRQVILGALNWTVEWFNPEKGGKAGFYTLQEMVALQQSLLLDGIVSRNL